MKKILFFIVAFFLLMSVNITGQTYYNQQQQQQNQQKYVPPPSTIQTINITSNQIQNGWSHHGTSCAGCPAYWCQILRSQTQIQAEDGVYYYYYYFNFFSHSFYTNGSQASTYLSQLNFYHDDIFAFSAQYILLPAGQTIWGAWMRLSTPNSAVTFTVTNISVH